MPDVIHVCVCLCLHACGRESKAAAQNSGLERFDGEERTSTFSPEEGITRQKKGRAL